MRKMNDGVALPIIAEQLVTDFSGGFPHPCCAVKDGLPRRIGSDFMDDQCVWQNGRAFLVVRDWRAIGACAIWPEQLFEGKGEGSGSV